MFLRLFKIVLMLLMTVFSIAAFQYLLPLADRSPGLTDAVMSHMDESGVKHPLTAVLLNFRGYDTMLEIGVLLLAVLAVWSLGSGSQSRFRLIPPPDQSPLINKALGILVPVSILIAGYLVWVGAYLPGGAFQAGTVLGAVWVVLVSTGMIQLPLARDGFVRILLSAGFLFFISAALVMGLSMGQLLEYPKEYAGIIILIIETLLSVSIGTAIGALFSAVASPEQANSVEGSGHE